MTTDAPLRQPSDGLFPVGQSTPLGEYLRELWARRDYIVRVPLADLRSQNAHTLLGGIWLVLNPLLQVGVYFLVFGVIMPIDRESTVTWFSSHSACSLSTTRNG